MNTSIVIALILLLNTTTALAGRFEKEIPARITPAATFYVDGYVEGYGRMDMMIDTGSSYVTINETALRTLQEQSHATYVRDLSGTLADGSKMVVPIYRITSLTIGDNCRLNDIEAAVFPGKTRSILGLSALSRAAPFAISVEPPSLLLSHCDTKPQRLGERTAN